MSVTDGVPCGYFRKATRNRRRWLSCYVRRENEDFTNGRLNTRFTVPNLRASRDVNSTKRSRGDSWFRFTVNRSSRSHFSYDLSPAYAPHVRRSTRSFRELFRRPAIPSRTSVTNIYRTGRRLNSTDCSSRDITRGEFRSLRKHTIKPTGRT